MMSAAATASTSAEGSVLMEVVWLSASAMIVVFIFLPGVDVEIHCIPCGSNVIGARHIDRRLLVRITFYRSGLSARQEVLMKSHTEYLWFNTPRERDYINITRDVERIVAASGIAEGFVLVSAMHITAGVYVNDAESGLIADIDEWLELLAPFRADYRHHRTGETNGDAHLKSLLIHHEVIVPITGGRLDLGPWQQVYYAEFDGRRRKRVVVKAIGE